jgi:two-component system sensor histidine kinase VicK
VLKVRADSDLIKRVLNNLLSNAIKFTPGGGSVRMSARVAACGVQSDDSAPQADDAHYVEVSVEDTGTGIPVGELESVFDKFYRVENASEEAADGTGLGLSITKEIVEAHGGRIWAERAEGGGTKFKFTIPLGDA